MGRPKPPSLEVVGADPRNRISDRKPAALDDWIMETMIDLARISKSHRVIVAGAHSTEMHLGLHRRGYCRVATTTSCRIPRGQHDVALVAGRHSIQALEAILGRVVPCLNTAAALSVWVEFGEQIPGLKLRLLLERLGFRIEVATSCADGFVFLARRRESGHVANAA